MLELALRSLGGTSPATLAKINTINRKFNLTSSLNFQLFTLSLKIWILLLVKLCALFMQFYTACCLLMTSHWVAWFDFVMSPFDSVNVSLMHLFYCFSHCKTWKFDPLWSTDLAVNNMIWYINVNTILLTRTISHERI